MTSSTEAAAAHAERSPETTRTRTITWQDPLSVAAAGAQMKGIDYMRALAAGELPPPPIAVLMRMQPVELEPERVRADAEVLYRGRRQATAQAKLTDAAGGKLLAHATATCMILGA